MLNTIQKWRPQKPKMRTLLLIFIIICLLSTFAYTTIDLRLLSVPASVHSSLHFGKFLGSLQKSLAAPLTSLLDIRNNSTVPNYINEESSNIHISNNSIVKDYRNFTKGTSQGKSDNTGDNMKPKEKEDSKPHGTKLSPEEVKFRKALNWTGAPLIKGQPQWQMLDSKFRAFVYSAHFDDVDSPAVIKIIGVVDEKLPYTNITCRFYDLHHRPSMHNVSGTLYLFRGRNGRKYVGSYVDCPLPSPANGSLPFAVSVRKWNESLETNYMIIHYSHSDDWLQDNKNQTRWFENAKVLSSNKPGTSNNAHGTTSRGQEKPGWKWNITRCFPALQNRFNNHVLLAEMVAASKVLGVQHFVFYVESAGSNVLRLLQVLENEGLAEVHSWNLHLYGSDLYYVAQFSAIQDCLYRNLWSSRFLLFGDVDELFVPRQQHTLLPLLQSVFEQQPDCGAFLFLNVFYNLNLATQRPPLAIDPDGYAVKNRLTILTHVEREIILGPGVRSKPAVDPHKVFTGSVHVIQTFRKGFKSCTMNKTLGLLHHYRHSGLERNKKKKQTIDPFIWWAARDIIKDVKDLLLKFNSTAEKLYP